MPGPRNSKKKFKSKKKSKGNVKSRPLPVPPVHTKTASAATSESSDNLPRTPVTAHTVYTNAIYSNIVDQETSDPHALHFQAFHDALRASTSSPIPEVFTKAPCIHDPGTGPRVRDMEAFLASSFAARPAYDDPLAAEFAQEEVLEMLAALLPIETAQILWYNKSRGSARVCPACQRLYQLGDVMREPFADPDSEELEEGGIMTPELDSATLLPALAREQELSGLCSPVCFLLAAYAFSTLIPAVWGCTAEELDDATWAALNAPGPADELGLGLLLKMTRCRDLGLAELLFPELAGGEHGAWEEGGVDIEDVREGVDIDGDLGQRMIDMSVRA